MGNPPPPTHDFAETRSDPLGAFKRRDYKLRVAMLTTKRYDYVEFEQIQKHPLVENHRPVNPQKVAHYRDDILRNGLLEPLVVWERKPRELFLVGGFHRLAAIGQIRRENPGYYDRVDVRVVEYFDTVIFLNNANWEKARIASFLDKSVSWIEDILRFAPSMDPRIRALLEKDKISWSRAKAVCRRILDAAPGEEKATADAVVRELEAGPAPTPRRALSAVSAHKRLAKVVANDPDATYTVSGRDLLSLLSVLAGRDREHADDHLKRIRASGLSALLASGE